MYLKAQQCISQFITTLHTSPVLYIISTICTVWNAQAYELWNNFTWILHEIPITDPRNEVWIDIQSNSQSGSGKNSSSPNQGLRAVKVVCLSR